MSVIKYLYVYILKCIDGSYYTGITNNPERRLKEHSKGINRESYTYLRRPVEIVYCERFSNYIQAIEWEKRIKGWTRKKKEALIGGRFILLHELAECKNESHSRNKKSCFDSAQHDYNNSAQHDNNNSAQHDNNNSAQHDNNNSAQHDNNNFAQHDNNNSAQYDDKLAAQHSNSISTESAFYSISQRVSNDNLKHNSFTVTLSGVEGGQ